MKTLTVQPGKHISSDVGLSDEFPVQTVDDAGNAILFDFEPREWLAEWETVRCAKVPAGGTYSRTLTVCGSPFKVHFPLSSAGERIWEFAVFDILSRTERQVTLSETEVLALAENVRSGLNR